MKIRNGFVSNSSTSSFVLIMSKASFEESFAKMDDYQKEVIDQLGYSEDKFLGNDIVVVSGCNGNRSSFEYMEGFKTGIGMNETEFYETFGYDQYPEEAFDAIEWPEDMILETVDC